MDVKQYYRKVGDAESTIHEQYPLLVSLETEDGGKAGVMSEVTRDIAAKMIVEGRAVLATEEQRERYRECLAAAKKSVESAELARRLQVAIISETDLHVAGTSKKPSSGK